MYCNARRLRDPNGIRPVGMASRKVANGGEGLDYIFK